MAQNYLHWVGGKFWSIESFLQEVSRIGISVRIGTLPTEMEFGVSKVYLVGDLSEEERKSYLADRQQRKRSRRAARRKGLTYTPPTEPPKRGVPSIFGYFVVQAGVYVTNEEHPHPPPSMQSRGVQEYAYNPEAFGFQDERECGSLQPGGLYLITSETMRQMTLPLTNEQVQSLAISGDVVPLANNIALPQTLRFRGIKAVDEQMQTLIDSATGQPTAATSTDTSTQVLAKPKKAKEISPFLLKEEQEEEPEEEWE